MTEVIYLAPLCQGYERMWCEHDAPIDCECIDGPHPWIKYIAALRQPAQSEITQADTDAMESILWVDTIIDDKEAIAKAFARHRQYGYDQGYYDGCTRQHTQSDADIIANERKAIAAWMRGGLTDFHTDAEYSLITNLADAIERGTYLQEQGK